MSKIFLAEDDPDLARLLKIMLRRAGHQISTFAHGEAALEALDREQPDVFIMDIDRPDLNGEELCRRIDARLPKRRFPIFCISAAGAASDQSWTRRVHDLHFMEKPVSPERVARALTVSPERD